MSELLIKNVTLDGKQVDIRISGNRILEINPIPQDGPGTSGVESILSGIAGFFSGISSGDHHSGKLPDIAKVFV